MTDRLDPLVERELDRWRITAETPDWDDVVARRRADDRPRARRERRVYVAVAAAVIIGVAAPAFALVADRLFTGRALPGTITTVRVKLGSRSSAVLRLRSHGSPLTRGVGGFHYVGSKRDPSRAFLWRIDLDGVDGVGQTRVRLDTGRVVALCRSCSDGSRGTFTLRGDDALKLLDGQATLEIGSARTRITPAAGGRLQKTDIRR